MQVLKYGEIARYFSSEDLANSDVISLTNKFNNDEITSDICNGEIHQQGSYVSLDINRSGSTDIVTTTKYLDYVLITLNTENARKSYYGKRLVFECKMHMLDRIKDQELAVIGDYGNRSWSLISVNDGKFEFFNNDDLTNIQNYPVKSVSFQKDSWIVFDIDGVYDDTNNVYRYTIKINGQVAASSITGKKLDSNMYDDASVDDSLMLFNVDRLKTASVSRNNILYKNVVLYRQYEQYLKKPTVKITRKDTDRYITLTADVIVDDYVIDNLDETGKGYTCQWDNGETNEVLSIPANQITDYVVKTLTVTDSAGQICRAFYVVENLNEYDNFITAYTWCTTGEMGKTIEFNANVYEPYKVFRYLVRDAYGKSIYGSYYYENLSETEDRVMGFKWNTGETSNSITVTNNDEYSVYSCIATDDKGNQITDSYVVNNFEDLSKNRIESYEWSTGETLNSIEVPSIEEVSSFSCTVTDSYSNSSTGYYIVENFKPAETANMAMSYLWNTGEIVPSIVVDPNNINDQYGVYTCRVTDMYSNYITDSYVIENFAEPPENRISSYLWNTGETTTSITVDTENIDEYRMYDCTVENTWGKTAKGYFIIDNATVPVNTEVKYLVWNTGSYDRTITVDKTVIDEYQTYYCRSEDNFSRYCTGSTVVTNFRPVENSIDHYTWNTGEKTQSIDVDLNGVDEYSVYTCTATDTNAKRATDSIILCNFKPVVNNIVAYSWNTGEITQSIEVSIDLINEYSTYYCAVTDSKGRIITDSVILTNFHEPYNNIESYRWNTGETTQSIDVDITTIDEYGTYSCTVKDIYNHFATDSAVLTNMHSPVNSIKSYMWNTGDSTESITVDISGIDNYETYYCTVIDEYNTKITDSIILSNFHPVYNEISYYTWNTGETTQSISVDLSNVDEYQTYYCTVVDLYAKTATDSTVVENFKPIVNDIKDYLWNTGDYGRTLDVDLNGIDEMETYSCRAIDLFDKEATDSFVVLKPYVKPSDIMYTWNTGETTESILVDLHDVDEYKIYSCTATLLNQYSTTDQYIVENFAEIHNDFILYVWNTYEIAQSIDVNIEDIDNYQVFMCEGITEYNMTVTDSYVLTNFQEPHTEIASYLWDNGETTQTIEVDTSAYLTPEILSCTVTDDHNYSTTGFVTVSSDATIYTYEWTKDDTVLSLTSKLNVAKNGIYTVSATNEQGRTVTKDIELTGLGLHPTVSITSNPATIEAGESITLIANAADQDGVITGYKWYKEENGERTLINDTDDSITVTPVDDNEVYVVEVTDDDNYTAEESVTITFVSYSEVLFYSYAGQTYMIPLHSVYKPDSINIRKNGKDYYACYVDVNDPDASDINVKINNDVKRLQKL